MSSRTIRQNITSGILAGAIALAVYVTISSLFNQGLSRSILLVGILYGIGTFVATVLISRIISTRKAKG